MAYGEDEPNPMAKHTEKTFEFKPPFQAPDYTKLALSHIQREQTTFLKNFWGHFSGLSISDKNPNNFERALMPSESSLKKDKLKQDSMIAKLIMQKANLGEDESVIWLAMQITTNKGLDIVCNWLRSQEKYALEGKIRELYPVFNHNHFLDNSENKIMVIKEKIIDNSARVSTQIHPYLTVLSLAQSAISQHHNLSL